MIHFLSAFAKFRKATVSFVMSVRQHGTTLLPLAGFSWNLVLEFSKIVEKIQIWLKLTRITGALH